MESPTRIVKELPDIHPEPQPDVADKFRNQVDDIIRARIGDLVLAKPVKEDNQGLADFQKKHGIDVVTKDGKYEYRLQANGDDKLLFKTDATAPGLKAAETEIKKLVNQKIKDLNTDYKVTFSTAGEDVVNQWVEKADCTWERGAMVKAREPQLKELYGIEAAIKHANPSHLLDGGKTGIKFYFLTTNYYKDYPVLAYHVHSDKNGKSAIYFDAGANEGKPATEKDADKIGKHQLFSVEALTLHELNHNGQQNMRWDDPKVSHPISRSIGWIPFEDPKDHATKWILKGKDGQHFRYDKEHCKDSQVWFRCTDKGEPLNAKGEKVVSIKDAETVPRTNVQDQAQVTPMTYYFPNPMEMFTEGLMMLRLNAERRASLLKQSPTMYVAAKEYDQKEIDQMLGKDGSGASKFIRSPEGIVVDNNAANRKAVDDFEAKHKTPKK